MQEKKNFRVLGLEYVLDRESRPVVDEDPDLGLDPCVGSSVDPGLDPALIPGFVLILDPGSDPNLVIGLDSSSNPGLDPGFDLAFDLKPGFSFMDAWFFFWPCAESGAIARVFFEIRRWCAAAGGDSGVPSNSRLR